MPSLLTPSSNGAAVSKGASSSSAPAAAMLASRGPSASAAVRPVQHHQHQHQQRAIVARFAENGTSSAVRVAEPSVATVDNKKAATGGDVVCKLSVPYKCGFGEVVKVVGSHPDLGAWDAHKAPAFTWQASDVWTREVRLPAGTHELKAVIYNQETKTARWELVANRIVDMPAADGVLHLKFTWGSPDLDLSFSPATTKAAASKFAELKAQVPTMAKAVVVDDPTPATKATVTATTTTAGDAAAAPRGAVSAPDAELESMGQQFERQILGLLANRPGKGLSAPLLHDLLHFTTTNPKFDKPPALLVAYLGRMQQEGKVKYDEEQDAWIGLRLPTPPPVVTRSPAPARRDASPRPAAQQKPTAAQQKPVAAPTPAAAPAPAAAAVVAPKPASPAAAPAAPAAAPAPAGKATGPLRAVQYSAPALAGWQAFESQLFGLISNFTALSLERLHNIMTYTTVEPKFTQSVASLEAALAELTTQGFVAKNEQGWYTVVRVPEPATPPPVRAVSPRPRAATPTVKPATPKPAARPRSPVPVSRRVPTPQPTRLAYPPELREWAVYETQTLGLVSNFTAISLDRLFSVMTLTMVDPKFNRRKEELGAYLDWLVGQGQLERDDQGWYAYVADDAKATSGSATTATKPAAATKSLTVTPPLARAAVVPAAPAPAVKPTAPVAAAVAPAAPAAAQPAQLRASAPTPVRAVTPPLVRQPDQEQQQQQQQATAATVAVTTVSTEEDQEVVEEVFVVRRIAPASASRSPSPATTASTSTRARSPRAGSPRAAPQPDPALALPVSQMPKEVPIWWPAAQIPEYRTKRATGEIPPLPAPAAPATPRPPATPEAAESATDNVAVAVAMMVLAGVIFTNVNTGNGSGNLAAAGKAAAGSAPASAARR